MRVIQIFQDDFIFIFVVEENDELLRGYIAACIRSRIKTDVAKSQDQMKSSYLHSYVVNKVPFVFVIVEERCIDPFAMSSSATEAHNGTDKILRHWLLGSLQMNVFIENVVGTAGQQALPSSRSMIDGKGIGLNRMQLIEGY